MRLACRVPHAVRCGYRTLRLRLQVRGRVGAQPARPRTSRPAIRWPDFAMPGGARGPRGLEPAGEQRHIATIMHKSPCVLRDCACVYLEFTHCPLIRAVNKNIALPLPYNSVYRCRESECGSGRRYAATVRVVATPTRTVRYLEYITVGRVAKLRVPRIVRTAQDERSSRARRVSQFGGDRGRRHRPSSGRSEARRSLD